MEGLDPSALQVGISNVLIVNGSTETVVGENGFVILCRYLPGLSSGLLANFMMSAGFRLTVPQCAVFPILALNRVATLALLAEFELTSAVARLCCGKDVMNRARSWFLEAE